MRQAIAEILIKASPSAEFHTAISKDATSSQENETGTPNAHFLSQFLKSSITFTASIIW